MRKKIDEIIDTTKDNERFSQLEKLGILLSKKDREEGGGDCEDWAFDTLGLNYLRESYSEFIVAMPTNERFQYRFIDFLVLNEHVTLVDSYDDGVLLTYWHSSAPYAKCTASGLPHYSHYAICEKKESSFVSRWGIGGEVYRSSSAWDLPTSYGDRMHIFKVN